MGKHGIDINDSGRLVKLIDNVSIYYDNAEGLVDYFKETEDAEAHRQSLKQENVALKREKEDLKRENKLLQEQIDEKHEALVTAQIFTDTGIKSGQASTISNLVKEVASKNGYPKTRALDKICQDIHDYYDPILGFEARLKHITNESESKQRVLDELEISLNRRREENRNQQTVIAELGHLNEQGVGNDDLIEWNKILDENNLDPHTLRREIKSLEGLKQVTSKRKESINTLEVTAQNLQTEISFLENRKNHLASFVNKLEQDTERKIKKLTKELKSQIKKIEAEILSPETGVKTRVDRLVGETVQEISETLKSYNTEWLRHHQTLSNIIQESAKTVAALEEKTYEAGKMIGEVIHLESVLKLCRNEPLSTLEEEIGVISLALILMNHLTKKNLTRSVTDLNRFIQTYSNEVLSIV
jgi:cell division protein FtsB